MQDFKGLGLPPALVKTLEAMNYNTPTPIQAQTIPLALQGKDVMGTAQTGTGKTAAFGIPLITKLLTTPRGSALILLPTRELAVQVLDVLKAMLGKHSTVRTALLIGGDSMPAQVNELRGRPRLIVGTPGRINDHLARGTLMLHDVGFLVLDETDRMLDMGFAVQLEKIIKFLPPQRQTLMFSATMPDNILKLAGIYLKNPERVAIGAVNKVAANLRQEVIHTTSEQKYGALLNELAQREGSIIVFVKTKHGADRLAQKLNKQNHSADAIHGDLHQRKRERVIEAFRDRKHRIMVATDIAARGLDIPHIEHVINYDLPQCPEDFIHRIGRTARAGAEGSTVCLLAPEDSLKWREIHKILHPGEPLPPLEKAAKKPHGNHNGGPSRSDNHGKSHRRRFRSRPGGGKPAAPAS